jgi:hypothetical protein
MVDSPKTKRVVLLVLLAVVFSTDLRAQDRCSTSLLTLASDSYSQLVSLKSTRISDSTLSRPEVRASIRG